MLIEVEQETDVARLTPEMEREIEAVNKEQARNLDSAMQNMRAGVPGAAIPAGKRGPGRPSNAGREARAQGNAQWFADPNAPDPNDLTSRPFQRDPDGEAIIGGSILALARAVVSPAIGDIVIDTDVPPPEGAPCGSRYPWHQLAVGQSFFTPTGPKKRTISAMAAAHRRLKPMRFRQEWTARDSKYGVPGVRVWRVA